MWFSKHQLDNLRVAELRLDHEKPARLHQSLAQRELWCSSAKPERHQTLSIARSHARRLQGIPDITTALVSSAIAPAVLMTAIWSDPGIAPLVFALTLVIALGHAVVLGLPIFLMLWFRGSISVTACVMLGFAIGVVPAGLLTFPVSGVVLYANTSGDRAIVANGIDTAAIWVGSVKPLMYLGLLGAFGALVFWLVLMLVQDWKPRSAAPYQKR
jgi:hypothetical protein